MILRKPYALFIKLFKPIHLILSFFAAYLIFLSTKILTVFTSYIYSEDVKKLSDYSFNNLNFIFPILLIILCFLIYLVMSKKKKPTKMYKYLMIFMIIIIGINFYTNQYMNSLGDVQVTIANIKLLHDLMFINIIFEGISFSILFSRGLGLDIKKFDFNSDILNIDISEEDREEIEVTVNVDVEENIRKRNKKLRKLRYFILEHKFFIYLGIASIFLILIITILAIKLNPDNRRKEHVKYTYDSGYITVNRSYILNQDYMGNKISDKYYIVIDVFLSSYREEYNYYLKDFKLNIGNTLFSPNKSYGEEFRDLGTLYNSNILNGEGNSYLLIYEVPKKYINDKMILYCFSTNKTIKINLSPLRRRMDINSSYKLSEKASISNLNNVEYTINSYEIENEFILKYNHCINKYCIDSKEYLKPQLDQDYDESILKLNVDYNNNDEESVKNFYNLFKKYGYIKYTIGEDTYYMYNGFSEVVSNKVNTKNDVYIEIDRKIKDADSIELIFNVKGTPFKYVLKEAE